MARWLVFQVVDSGKTTEVLHRIGTVPDAPNIFKARDIAKSRFPLARLVIQSAIDHKYELEETAENAKRVPRGKRKAAG